MKSITIHGIDDHLAQLLKDEAKRSGASMNRTIKRLLEEALGLKPRPAGANRAHFERFLGVWSSDDLARFRAAVADLETGMGANVRATLGGPLSGGPTPGGSSC